MEVLRKTTALRIQKQTEGRAPEEVRDIALSGVPVLTELLTPFTQLTHLTLVCMKPKLTSLLPLSLQSFTSLRLLDVGDNLITIDAELPVCPELRRLLAPNNRIATMEEVKRLAACCPLLEVLDLADNAVDTADRFNALFALFPSLVVLDSKTSDGVEVVVEDSDESDSTDEDSDDDDDSEEEGEETEGGESSSTTGTDSQDSDESSCDSDTSDEHPNKKPRTE